MYESFFQFQQRPFAAVPHIERYYPAKGVESARVAAARCIERAEGFAVIIGSSGTGKTLLCQVLAEQFRDTLTPVLLSGGRIASRKALLQSILYELGLPFRRREEGELRLAMMDRIGSARDSKEGLLLLIDEAQTLAAKMFEELRLLSNVVRQGKSRVRLVFAGSAAMEERLAHPKLASFQQRIVVRSTLTPFSAAETQEYVRAQTAVVGGDPDAIWSDDALLAIHHHTDGVPRLINQVCDHALLLAATGGVAQLSAAGIDEAWADLQQLPFTSQADFGQQAPSATTAASEAVIEFGTLDDEPAPNVLAAADHSAAMIDALLDDDLSTYEPPLPGPTEAELVMQLEELPHGKPTRWEPVTAGQRQVPVLAEGTFGEDPVLPDTDAQGTPPPTSAGAPRIVPLRTVGEGPFASVPIIDDPPSVRNEAAGWNWDHADIVYEEDTPSYLADASSGWGPPVATPPAAAQRAATSRRPVQRQRPRKFAQLFTKLQQQ